MTNNQASLTCLLGRDCPSCEADHTSTCDYLDGTWYVLPLPLDPE